MNRLFSLPSNIISLIYEMDITYRDKFQKEVQYEIFKTSWVRFINIFMSQPIFTNEPIVSRKFELIFEYLQSRQNGYISLPSDQITITSSWKRLKYDNYHISHTEIDYYDSDTDTDEQNELYFNIYFNNIPNRDGYSRRLECMVYTYSQYEDRDPDDWFSYRKYCEVNVYENHEFKIVQILRR